MDTSKWSLVLAYILALIGYLFWLLEAKWKQRNITRLKRRSIIICGIVWGVVMVALAIVNYRIAFRHVKTPQFTCYLNGLAITNNACITIPATNTSIRLQYSIRNIGDFEAEDVALVTLFPRALKINPSEALMRWAYCDGYESNATNDIADAGLHGGTSQSMQRVFPSGGIEGFAPLTLQVTNLNCIVSNLELRIQAKNDLSWRTKYNMHITNGVGKPYIGF